MSFVEALRGWHDFYILTGTAAATLIGLMFVALSLGSSLRQQHRTAEDIDAFVTPSMVYFAEALFIAALAVSPVEQVRVAAAILGSLAALTLWPAVRRMRRLLYVHSQDPIELKDWIWHFVAPTSTQLVLVACGVGLMYGDGRVPYALAGATSLLIAAGVRNAWTLVLWILEQRAE
jgi:hypothetical protein